QRRLRQPGQRAGLQPARVALAPDRRPQLRPRGRGGDGQGRAGEARRRGDRRRASGRRGARGPLRGRADVGTPGKRPRGVPAAPGDLRRAAPMARVVSIATDLMLSSRVEEGLRAAGHEVVTVSSVEGAPLDGAEAIVADLDVADPEALAATEIPVLGY